MFFLFISQKEKRIIDLSPIFFLLFKVSSFHHHSTKPSWSRPMPTRQQACENRFKQRLDVSCQKHLPCFAPYSPLLYHVCQFNGTISPVDVVFFHSCFCLVWCRLGCIVYKMDEILAARGKKAFHIPELIIVDFTGNKVCWIHSFMAINQNENELLWFNLPDSGNHHISWYCRLICTSCFLSKPILVRLDVSKARNKRLTKNLWEHCAHLRDWNVNCFNSVKD